MVGGVGRDPGAARPPVAGQQRDGGWLVVGDRGHAQGAEGFAGGALDGLEGGSSPGVASRMRGGDGIGGGVGTGPVSLTRRC
ncbi:hypothetical protein GCM10010353_24390 [Streptomyces chryseus]|nr:hypothetical protein GCM10010353_24390 [Streptomyces chryseus]